MDFTSFGSHIYNIYKLLAALFFSRVQHAKMAILKTAPAIGYTPVQSRNQLSQLLLSIYTHASIANELSDSFQLLIQLDHH